MAMKVRYSRERVREVAYAATVAALIGLWIGARASDESLIESGVMVALAIVGQVVGFPLIDKRHATPSD